MRLNLDTLWAREVEGGRDCYYVAGHDVATGKMWAHNGPHNADYFTKDQADRLVNRIKAADGVVDPEHWYSDDGGYYNEDYAYQMVEWEETEKLAGRW